MSWTLCVWLALVLVACQPHARGGGEPRAAAKEAERALDRAILQELRVFEKERRTATDFLRMPPSEGRFGADPYRLSPLGDGRVLGVLRGSSELVVLDPELRAVARFAGPPSTIAAVVDGRWLVAAGERSSALWIYEAEGDGFRLRGRRELPGVFAIRDLLLRERRLFVVEEDAGRLLTLDLDVLLQAGNADENEPLVLSEQRVGNGPFQLRSSGAFLLVNCLLDHEVTLFDVSRTELVELARVRHDGPIWEAAFLPSPEDDAAAPSLVLAGVEDHPLDRTIGSFGYIDSFVYLYRLQGTRLRRVSSLNVAEHGLVTPKSVIATPSEDGPEFLVAAYGSPLTLRVGVDADSEFEIRGRIPTSPGITGGVRVGDGFVLANTLTDRWVSLSPEGNGFEIAELPETASVGAQERLGEALFFTHLMAPFNSSEGAFSRFTCETCHFEGTVDGRTHHTGRGDVHATTKSLRGLFNNRPHFSRALDEDLSKIAHAEFRVAGANSGHSPVFDVALDEHRWLAELNLPEPRIDAVSQRKALMAFLMRFTPRSNPRVVGRTSFSANERRGAVLFEQYCESCHAARSSADEANSRQPFEDWERTIFQHKGVLVWGSDGYKKTGIEPYVHQEGARTPSLRRLYKKYPYFTNGSAKTLDDVLSRVRLGPPFSHAAGEGRSLTGAELAALRDFLRLL